MSNNQWNSGSADNQWQPQGSAAEWPQSQQSAQGASEWNTQDQSSGQSNDWNSQQTSDWQQQSQPSAQEWNQPQAQPSAQEWNQQPAGQDWNQQPAGQDWNQQQNFGAAPATQNYQQPQQQFGQQMYGNPSAGGGFGNIFDFSFRKNALPSAAGIAFMIAVILIGVMWLFDFITTITVTNEFTGGAMNIVNGIVGGLAEAFLKILLIRAFLEGMVALVKMSNKDS